MLQDELSMAQLNENKTESVYKIYFNHRSVLVVEGFLAQSLDRYLFQFNIPIFGVMMFS